MKKRIEALEMAIRQVYEYAHSIEGSESKRAYQAADQLEKMLEDLENHL